MNCLLLLDIWCFSFRARANGFLVFSGQLAQEHPIVPFFLFHCLFILHSRPKFGDFFFVGPKLRCLVPFRRVYLFSLCFGCFIYQYFLFAIRLRKHFFCVAFFIGQCLRLAKIECSANVERDAILPFWLMSNHNLHFNAEILFNIEQFHYSHWMFVIFVSNKRKKDNKKQNETFNTII